MYGLLVVVVGLVVLVYVLVAIMVVLVLLLGSVCVGGVDLFTLETESDGTITITTQKYSPNTNVFFQTCWQSQLLI